MKSKLWVRDPRIKSTGKKTRERSTRVGAPDSSGVPVPING